MLHAQDPGAQAASDLGQCCQSGQGSAWNLQQDLRSRGHGTPYGHQHSSSGNIDGGGKFQEFLVAFVLGADKNRDGQWQAGPSTALSGVAVYFHQKTPLLSFSASVYRISGAKFQAKRVKPKATGKKPKLSPVSLGWSYQSH